MKILSPDTWADPVPPVRYEIDGRAVSLVEALGFSPEQVPVINHLGISGGKDSDTLLLWALHESGYSKQSIVATNCDTFNEDQETYKHLDLLRERHPIHAIIPGKTFWDLVRHKGMFPMRKKRFCTQYLKMEPTRFFVHDLVSAGFKVVLHAGVRADESDDRSKLPPEEAFDSYFALPIKRPLLAKTLGDVLEMHKRYGLPLNPLYALGARRVGCFPCINSVKREVRLVAQHRPEKIDFIEQQEKELCELTNRKMKGGGTFFHRNTVPSRFRSMDYITKEGKKIKVASIRDIVEWSMTGYRARGKWDDSPMLKGFKEDDAAVCSLTYGACE